MISEKEVKHIAKLARLELTDKEIKKMKKNLSAVLDYFDVLKSAPALPKQSSGETRKANVAREDEVKKDGVADKIIDASPNKKDRYIKVKNIL